MIDIAMLYFSNLLRVLITFFVNISPGYLIFVVSVFVGMIPYIIYKTVKVFMV